MKLPLHLLLLTPTHSLLPSVKPHTNHLSKSTALHYKPTNEDTWSVLANTERWISETLDKSNESANKAKAMHYADDKTPDPLVGEKKDNPYARKEVTYVCEMGDEVVGVIGGIFRRVREARELGERFGKEHDGETTSMRQTNVVVVPSCSELSEFKTFDAIVRAINSARRSARDFNFKKDESDNKNWVVSINCAHLHPQYGELSPDEQLQAMKAEEETGEVDLNLQEYKKRRDEARRSPYPSVIVEVQSTPPPEFTPSRMKYIREEGEEEITMEDIHRLNALLDLKLGAPKDGGFYDALGEAFGDKQISVETPMSKAQNWVLDNDSSFNQETSTFTSCDTRHADKAYEYVFNSIAMSLADSPKQGQKSYIVLPEFLPNSSFSFVRFAGLVSKIIESVPTVKDKLSISTFHPEHIDAAGTSPVPIFVVTWN
jgi:hypothetical protein